MPRCFLLSLIALLLAGISIQTEAQLGINLIVNGNAEQGVFIARIGGFDRYTTPGWTTTGNFVAELYSDGSVNDINTNSPGPSDRGRLLFIGGSSTISTAIQSVNVAGNAVAIDAEQIYYELSGWFGGYRSENDNTILSASFLDSNGAILLTTVFGPVLASNRNNISGLLYRQDNGTVPIGTRTIRVTLTMTRVNGNFNNAAADNISLSLSSIPSFSAQISGLITLQDSINQAQSVTFEFRPVDGLSGFSRTVTLAADATFKLTGIPRKSYNVRVKGAKWLAETISVNASNGDVPNANATLLAGDSNNDNFVDITDLLALIAHYNQTSPAAGYLHAVDFNDDGINDITDLLLLVGNYNKMGDV